MKKISSFLILVLLILSVFIVGCGPASDKSGETYTVTFNLNYTGAPKATSISVEEGASATKPENPTREKYSFGGWFSDSKCTKSFDFSTAISKNTVLYANWVSTAAIVTFDFNYANSENKTVEVDKGSAVTKPEDPTRENYAFSGWYTESTCKTEFNFSTKINEDISIYANWTQTAATISFDLGYDATTPINDVTVAIDGKITKPEDPTRENYVFSNWYSDKALTTVYDFNNAVTKDIVLYAKWEKTIAVVSYDLGYEDKKLDDSKVNVGSVATKPEDPTREGYTFYGWYTDAQLTNAYDFTTKVTDDVTLYAKWDLTKYTVTFNYNYSGAPDSLVKEVKHGESLENVDASRTGYNFIGWYTNAACTTSYDLTSIKENTVVYAGWSKVGDSNSVDVKLMLNYDGAPNGGLYYSETINKNYRIAYDSIAEPTREGYQFEGWYTTPECTTAGSIRNRFTEDTVYYANWVKKYTFEAEYTNLDGKGGVGYSVNVSGTKMIVQEDPKYNTKASNGYWVSYLYYTESFLEFDITSDKAVDDAILTIRLQVEYFDMKFNPSLWEVNVNGTSINYNEFSLAASSGDTTSLTDRREFVNITMAERVSLKEGKNVIKLIAKNDIGHGGTMYADAPMIDCIYVSTAANLTWEPKISNVSN